MNVPETYEKQFHISEYECDFAGNLRLSSLLRQTQEVSDEHCTLCGLTRKTHEQLHTAFLLTKVSVEFLRPLRAGKAVRLLTTPFAPVRAVYNRYTQWLGEDGKPAATVDARWVLFGTQSRRILRRPPEGFAFPFSKQENCAHSDTQIFPAEGEAAFGLRASYSLCDRNRHVNNAVYADIACDSLPADWFASGWLKKAVFNYRHELRMGEEMQVFCAPYEAQGYYVCGRKDNALLFEARLDFAAQP